MNADGQQVLFIGLDGAEPRLLRRWMTDGSLPVLARLSATGHCRDLEPLPGMGDGATWPSLISGVSPARHGRYFRRQLRPGSYERYPFDMDRHFTGTPFWKPASDNGRRVAILDLPYAPAIGKVNGELVTDWLIHDRYGTTRGYPESFVRRALTELGDDPIAGNSDQFRRSPECMAHLLQSLIRRVGMKTALIEQVLADGHHDLLATSFTEPHDAGHIMWHLHDPTHPQHDGAWLKAHGDPLKRLYQTVDTAIGTILPKIDSDASIVIFAGLGMGPNYTANNVMERLVRRLDDRTLSIGTDLRRQLSALQAPEAALRLGSRIDRTLRNLSDQRSRFFALPHNENSGAIRINLKGREPQGRVPAEDFDRVCADLADAFGELTNPETGRPVVQEVVKVSEHLSGARRADLPDLLVVWRRDEPFNSVYSPRLGRIEGAGTWGRTGDHTSNAMLVVHGPGGELLQNNPQASVLDVGPTIAALLGSPMGDVDGKPLCER